MCFAFVLVCFVFFCIMFLFLGVSCVVVFICHIDISFVLLVSWSMCYSLFVLIVCFLHCFVYRVICLSVLQ